MSGNGIVKIFSVVKSTWGGSFSRGSGFISSITSNAVNKIKTETPAEAKNFAFKTDKFKDDTSCTNPEELLGFAHSTCFCITLSSILESKKLEAKHIEVDAKVIMEMGNGYKISDIELTCNATIPGIEDKQFQDIIKLAKKACAISQVVENGTAKVTVDAKLNK